MSKFFNASVAILMSVMTSMAVMAQKYQVDNRDFEDWSAAAFDGQPQPKGWNASHVEQVGMKFNFAHKETGHNGGTCLMVQDQSVGAMGITETSPGYFSLGKPWSYLPDITKINQATAGTEGGIAWTTKPDTMSVWIKRTGNDWTKEDFYLLFYSWSGVAKSDKYKGKNGNCTTTSRTDEESDVRQAVNHNECGTTQKVTQVAEGMWRERKEYGNWTNIRVPIFYMSNIAPTTMNMIFSASNYPNYRANDGLYEGNSLYVDDIELIYAATIQKLFVNGVEWKGFDPKNFDVQNYPLGEDATAIPTLEAVRGAGSITNARGETSNFPGRTLSGSEISIANGDLKDKPTTITVKSGDGKTTRTYKIQFQKAASSNTKLAGISYIYKDKTGKNVIASVADFNPAKTSYTVELPYGTTAAPVLPDSLIDKQEEKQKIAVTQPASVNGTATILVTAPNNKATATYTLKFEVGKLADNTLKGITVNGNEVPGFTPNQTVYKVSLPVGTTKVPTIVAISEYPKGEQTIEYVLPTADKLDGGQAQIKVTTPGNQTPKIYKLNFKLEASSYSYLKDLKAGDYITNFAPEKLTYYVNLPLGTTSLPQITAVKGDEYQQEPEISLLGEGVVDGTVRITVTAANGDQTVYKIVFSTMKSEISTLSDLKVGGVTIEGFAPEKTTYDYPLPIGTTTLPAITYVADQYAEVKVTTGGVNGATRITVTAGNGNTTIYVINFSVAAYTDNTLKSLSVKGYDLLDEKGKVIAFDPEQNEYWVTLSKDTKTLPEVVFVRQDENLQTVNTRDGGLSGDYRITVRPQGGASRTYIIHFSVQTSSNTLLAMIYVDNKALEGFDPEVLEYTCNLGEGISTIPSVRADKGDESQKILIVQEDTIQTITVTAESGDKRVYILNFHIQLSANAFLRNIYLTWSDGIARPIAQPFDSTLTQYDIEFPEGEERAPRITVEKNPGQQVTITTPVAAGTAVILVAPEQGSPMEYRVTFVPKPVESVQLKSISIDGKPLDGFDAARFTYEASYQGPLPEVTFEAKEGQRAQLIWDQETAWIQVSDEEGHQASYSIVFSRTYYGVSTLRSILADGKQIAGFTPSTLNYAFVLPAGSTYPVLSYEKGHPEQDVLSGQLEEGHWNFIVRADDNSTATYHVRYSIAPYTNDTLEAIALEGIDLAFDENTFLYENIVLDEGADFPTMTIQAREGQKVLRANINDTEQQILVTAEDGSQSVYTFRYQRVKSNNALLANILIDGEPLEGFDPNVFAYEDSLALGSTVVPNIFPIAGNAQQVITTEYSRPDGTSRITVEAQDGSKQVYTLFFPLIRSNNTTLGDLYLNDEDAEIKYKPEVTEYEVTLPYEAKACPKIVYEKAEEAQRIDFVSRPIGQTSEITVTAENGDQRTYKILFKRGLLKTRNLLAALRIVETGKELSLRDREQREFEVEMPYGSRSMTVAYEKAYDEQTVFVQPGGVKAPTVITVKANNDTVADEVYTITPIVPTQDPAVLESITINGKVLAGFDKNRFSYIVKIDSKELEEQIVIPYGYNGATATPTITGNKHWQCVVSKEGRQNKYDIWFFYTQDAVPNAEFNSWTTAKNNAAPKPTGWHCLADYFTDYSAFASGTHTFGKNGEVEQVTVSGSNKAVKLNSKKSGGTQLWGGALGGILPAWIALDTIDGSLQEAGGSTFWMKNPGSGITFRNTPDIMLVKAKTGTVCNNNRIVYQLSGNGNSNLVFSTEANTDREYKFVLAQANKFVTEPAQLNIILNSFYKESMSTLTQGSEADLQVDYIRFTFNSALSGLKVNNKAATKNGTAFSVALDDAESVEVPVLSFTGEVKDQAQQVTWENPTVDQNTCLETRKASIINYAENGTTTTSYSLTVTRPLDSINVLSNLYVDGKPVKGFAEDKTAYTVELPSSRHHLPDIQPVPASSLQTVTTAFNEADSTMTITVKPEWTRKATTVYTVKVVTALSDDTTLAAMTAEGISYDPETTEYEITAAHMPIIAFDKQSDLQTVSVLNGLITVTAENGAVGTYRIHRKDPTFAPNGTISEFELKGDLLTDFGGAATDKTDAKPTDYIAFTRAQETDSVVFVQTPDKMTWSVPETEKTYTWTYPTAKSTNARLEGVLFNGELWSAFRPESFGEEQVLYADSITILDAIRGDERQTLVIRQELLRGAAHDVRYTIEVTPEEGEAKNYIITVKRPQGTEAALSMIYIDGDSLSGFRADSLNYVYTIPSPAVKTEQPRMPSITYVAAQHGQDIKQTNGAIYTAAKAGLETTLEVTAEGIAIGAASKETRTYNIKVEAEPSHCAALTGIMVNGVAIDRFEPGRHYYSVELNTSDVTIVPTADDRFLKIQQEVHGTTHTILVTAEDGVTKDTYNVDIFVKNPSNDTKLANILLEVDDELIELVDYRHEDNPKLKFDPLKPDYYINLPSGTKVAPSAYAQLGVDGQSVSISKSGMNVTIEVTAPDGVTTNQYFLYFETPKSKDANLGMIFLDGDSLSHYIEDEFQPDYYFYTVVLEEGVHALPEVAVQKGESHQKIDEIAWDQDKLQATISVHAEDGDHTSSYVLVFRYTLSEADTLQMIYADGEALKDFAPHTFFYNDSLEVGAVFPDLSWAEYDQWQTITMDTALFDRSTLIRQIHVTAESGKKNTYTLTYTIRQSAIDTLQMIYLDTRELSGFAGTTDEYFYTLSAAYANELNGLLPAVDFIKGDTAQSVLVTQALDSLDSKSLGYKSLITVTAASGKTRTYTIHYPVEKSDDATLNMIMLSGKPIVGFDSERLSYKLEVDFGADLPLVSVVKKEDAQVYDIRFSGDSIYVDVFAENGDQLTYSLLFERRLSSNANLLDLVVAGHDELRFRADEYDYSFVLPFGEDTIPAITWVLQDSLQTVPDSLQIDTLESGDILVTITVIAPNGEDESNYTLSFRFEKNSDNDLLALYLKDELVEGFDKRLTEYAYIHPFGADSTAFFGISDVRYELSDEQALDSVYIDEQGTLYVLVTAQNGAEKLYSITQTIALDGDNALSAILLDGDTIRGFDPDILNYTYFVPEGSMPPTLEAFARSENAEEPVWREVQAGDTCVITVTAQDKSVRKYYVHFALSQLDDALLPTANDVLLKHIPGTATILIGAIRQDITFALYDQFGNPFFRQPISIPAANANDVEVITDADQLERLNDIYNTRSGVLIDLLPDQIYIYGFYTDNNKKCLKSGKLMINR